MSAPRPLSAAAPPPVGRWPVPPVVHASVALHAGAAAAAALWPGAWPWALGAVAANHLALTAAGLWPRSRWLGPNVLRLPAARAAAGEIALTVDDGPDPELTPPLLDLLAARQVRATFFCIAQRVRAHPALARRIVEAGHSVQNHSLTHRHHFSLLGPAGLAREIGTAQAVLEDACGQRPHCFRAPAGLRNPLLDPVLHRLGLHLVSWTRRGFDTRDAQAGRVLRRLLGPGLQGGDILLLHDGHGRRDAAGRPVLLQTLPPLLEAASRAGLRWVTLAEALPPRGTPHGAAA